jgi:hypothetical protein
MGVAVAAIVAAGLGGVEEPGGAAGVGMFEPAIQAPAPLVGDLKVRFASPAAFPLK